MHHHFVADAPTSRVSQHVAAAAGPVRSPHRPTIMRRLPISLLAMLTVTLGATGCVNPRVEANVAQALNDAANQINNLQDDLATLQIQIDSLKTAMAKQDTLIDRLVAVTNIPR
jgi:hypothetical protein